MCAVRALTEGDPAATWAPHVEGATISGVVLKMGELHTEFGKVPFVDLWQGGTGRVRIKAFGFSLKHALDQAAPLVGDRLQLWYDGLKTVPARGNRPEQTYKAFTSNVQRGH